MAFILKVGFASCLLWLVGCSDSPQHADPNFKPQNSTPRFAEHNSPVVFIDQAHHNFLTLHGRYKPFAQVLESDGYTVKPNRHTLSLASLSNIDVLVIANALDRKRSDFQPPYGQAFTNEEITDIKTWVSKGGALFLVADHAPFPKVIENLAEAFGFEFSNGHVGDAVFNRQQGTLAEHPITAAPLKEATNIYGVAMHNAIRAKATERYIDQIRSFGGSAFKPPSGAFSLLSMKAGSTAIVPSVPFEVNANTKRITIDGWSQGAVMELGRGRVAVFAEGMMFSSQIDTRTGQKLGLTSQGAEQNERFLLNVVAWLVKGL
ncbi:MULTISPECIES: DUF4350 domain-containing protein [Pseudoalteromonas]|uniref:DUF4350 domain-containing protein n=1 Tax=Pseudoalteromonas luteoviolacea (strain 2ta16) TaxID=1353533 RepID=V4HYU7_PSEL2|nr:MULTISPECIES: DUF4350 domain-containing protein [Pseudoalteromonas]ESP93124.1 hypothetical protein PL2TA16_03345 [Pseudoalteromonas luteoviolacea 2ta16]KZN36996.1 hypothetical protein N483_21360 [Pseudoalteromonas luteoviolacea NCIMB 1944]MCG7549924.1 DUF4350 domain-containing protein [Pseudoalteromonas sp. Of7M-16]